MDTNWPGREIIFDEWLDKLFNSETLFLSEEHLQAIKDEIDAKEININDLGPLKLKVILKKLRLHKYYDHTVTIISILKDLPRPILDDALRTELKTLFKQIQQPFTKFCCGQSKSFFNYSFVLMKMFNKVNRPEFLPFIDQLKEHKRNAQEERWALMNLGW